MLLVPVLWAQDPNYLPEKLPSNYDDAEGREALAVWVNSSKTKHHDFTHMVIEPANWDDDQKWLKAYYEISIDLNDSLMPLKEVVDAVNRSNSIFRKAGDAVRVRFESYTEIKKDGLVLERIGVKKETLSPDFTPVLMQLHLFDSAFWLKSGTFSLYRGKIYGVSHYHLYRKVIHLADDNHLFELSHELNHALFNSRDAYYKRKFKLTWEQSRRLKDFNINSQDFSIDPLEVYVGIKRYGHEAPGWDDYVENQNCVLIDEEKMARQLSLMSDEELENELDRARRAFDRAQEGRVYWEQSGRFWDNYFKEKNKKKKKKK